MDDVTGSCFSLFCLTWCAVLKCLQDYSGLLIFRGKKKQNFAGFSGANSRKNRPISRDFRWKKVKIRGTIGRFSRERSQNSRKIGPFRGILAEKSQFSKDFQGQILRKIGRFHGKFRGETSPRNNQ